MANTLTQLRDIKYNSESLIMGDRNDPDNRIWVNDVKALDNAIEIIEGWQQLITFKKYGLDLESFSYERPGYCSDYQITFHFNDIIR